MKKNALIFSGMLVLALTFFMACKKDKATTTLADEAGYANDNAKLEQNFDDVQTIADQAAENGSLVGYRSSDPTVTSDPTILSGCATITHDTISIPHVLTIDFGPTNCMCNDGRYRRGQIIVTYNGHYRDSGYVHTITFNNYFVNDNQITGTKSVTNMGHNNLGQSYYNITVNGGIILANSAGTISWTSTRVRTWIAGENTIVRNDDVYSISGTSTVTRANNSTFSLNITSPLIKALNCNWIEQGTVQITPPNNVLHTLDYGNGNCDNHATMTVNGNTYNIILP